MKKQPCHKCKFGGNQCNCYDDDFKPCTWDYYTENPSKLIQPQTHKKETKYKISTTALLIAFLTAFLTSSVIAEQKPGPNKPCQYVRNYDGDTITVNIPDWPAIVGKKISIRIAKIDTPEKRDKNPDIKAMAKTAQRLVENLCKRAKKLELRNIQRGKYFRLVADVYADNKSIADLLIKNGLAKIYDGVKKNVWTQADVNKYNKGDK